MRPADLEVGDTAGLETCATPQPPSDFGVRAKEDSRDVRQNLGVGVTGRRAEFFPFGIGHERRPVLVARRQRQQRQEREGLVGSFRQRSELATDFLAVLDAVVTDGFFRRIHPVEDAAITDAEFPQAGQNHFGHRGSTWVAKRAFPGRSIQSLRRKVESPGVNPPPARIRAGPPILPV